jgi:hypothetical protein
VLAVIGATLERLRLPRLHLREWVALHAVGILTAVGIVALGVALGWLVAQV